MNVRSIVVMLGLVAGFTGGCRCAPPVSNIKASLNVSPASVDFGQVKNGTSAVHTLTLSAQTQTEVQISSLTLQNGMSAGGAEGFTVEPLTTPLTIDPLGSATLKATFKPTVLQAYEAQLVLVTNDEDHPTVHVPLLGEGSKPKMVVTPDCEASRKCVGTVVLDPPSIAFAPEPFVRLLPLDASTLPSVNVVNEGQVTLTITRLEVTGADAAAFKIIGNAAVPADVDPQAGFNVPLQFKPFSEQQTDYAADLVIESDDPDAASVTVHLTGALRPNLPPVVCANLIKVKPRLDSEQDFSSSTFWAPLLVPPVTGYDFSASRQVDPDAEYVIVSALSNPTDQTTCTTDPEDGRVQLTYAWHFDSGPPGAVLPAISVPFAGGARFVPSKVTGEYRLTLTVADAQGHQTSVPIKFSVAVKQDLVAQLQWSGFADVDLDVHLVRPSAVTAPADPFSGAFDFFQSGAAGKTSGDVNGWAVLTQKNNPGAGYDFNWGSPGTSDDPRLNIDDTGSGALLENVSLNFPENDPACATSRCNYKVLVHYFKDARTSDQGGCLVDGGTGCHDGEACGCPAENRCVAAGLDAGVGSGRCLKAPRPVVRIFLKGSAVPAKTIPLDTLMPADELAMGAPCQMLYVADVRWPAKNEVGTLPDGGTPPATVIAIGEDDGGTGRIASPVYGRFGRRQPGEIRACSPDTMLSGRDWYTEQ